MLTAYLAGIGYESFVDTDEGLQVFISEDEFDESSLKETIEEVEPFCAGFLRSKTPQKTKLERSWRARLNQ